jgi:hypothetical protein
MHPSGHGGVSGMRDDDGSQTSGWTARLAMGHGQVGHGAAADERAAWPTMGRRAVGHDVAVNERTVGEEAQTMSGHLTSGPTDKHEGVGGGQANKHEGAEDFVFCLGPLLGSRI